MYPEEDSEAIPGVEMYLQRIQDGGNDEVAFFPRTADQRAVEDSKGLKLTMRKLSVGMLGAGVLIEG
jgi:hypothetical protein